MVRHPAGLSIEILRRRCAVIGGDGQVTQGGPSCRHSSSAAAEKLFSAVFPQAHMNCCAWDDFHKDDLAVARCVKQIPAAQEVFDTAACLDSMFSIGDGCLVHIYVFKHYFESKGYPNET